MEMWYVLWGGGGGGGGADFSIHIKK
jgi:hypothetical protein